MHYTLTGMLIQPALHNKVALEQAFGYTLTEAGAVLLEQAELTKDDNSYVDVYQTASGTLVLCHPAFCEPEDKVQQLSTAGAATVFAVSNTALAYYFREYKAGVLVENETFETENESRRVGGWLLSLEEHTDLAYIMMDHFMFRYLGASFIDLPPKTSFIRYRVSQQ